jgi:hypothetical protein
MKKAHLNEIPMPEARPIVDSMPSAEELIERVPLKVLPRKERKAVLQHAKNLSNKPMTLEALIDEYVRGGREALARILYLSGADRHRIKTGLLLEKEKERVKDYPPEIRATIVRMMAETAALFTTIGIPDCAENLIKQRKSSEGGRGDRKPTDWHVWAEKRLREYAARNPAIPVKRADARLSQEPDRPCNLPQESRKVIGKLLRKIKSELRLAPKA